MSDEARPPFTCDHPHHAWQSRIAGHAEEAALHLRGLALLIHGLDSFREHSIPVRQDEMGAYMVLQDALRRIAETLEPPDPLPTETAPPPEPPDLTVVDGGKPA